MKLLMARIDEARADKINRRAGVKILFGIPNDFFTKNDCSINTAIVSITNMSDKVMTFDKNSNLNNWPETNVNIVEIRSNLERRIL